MSVGNKPAIGAVIGAAVGVVAGILTAPRSGKETRDDLKRKADNVKGTAVKKRDELLFKAEELGDDFKDKASDKVNSFTSALRSHDNEKR